MLLQWKEIFAYPKIIAHFLANLQTASPSVGFTLSSSSPFQRPFISEVGRPHPEPVFTLGKQLAGGLFLSVLHVSHSKFFSSFATTHTESIDGFLKSNYVNYRIIFNLKYIFLNN